MKIRLSNSIWALLLFGSFLTLNAQISKSIAVVTDSNSYFFNGYSGWVGYVIRNNGDSTIPFNTCCGRIGCLLDRKVNGQWSQWRTSLVCLANCEMGKILLAKDSAYQEYVQIGYEGIFRLIFFRGNDSKLLDSMISNEFVIVSSPNTSAQRIGENHSFQYALGSIYPNPFNPTAQLQFSIPERTNIQLEVFDLLGRSVLKILDEERPEGSYQISFSVNTLASGTYLLRLVSGKFIQAQKFILTK